MKRTLLITGLIAVCASSVFANDLWNQQGSITNASGGYVNQVFSDFPTYSSYGACDVVVGAAAGWNVSSVSIITYPGTGSNFTSGVLNIFANSGALPNAGNDPTTGLAVSITTTAGTGNLAGFDILTASGLNINLAAGEYWIGLAPNTTFANDGEPFFAYGTTNNAGANYSDAFINPGGGFGLGTGWQDCGTALALGDPLYGSIDVQGTVNAVPEPASFVALGLGLVGLVSRRRRA